MNFISILTTPFIKKALQESNAIQGDCPRVVIPQINFGPILAHFPFDSGEMGLAVLFLETSSRKAD